MHGETIKIVVIRFII